MALPADENGNIIATAGNNSMSPQGNPTQHAELSGAHSENSTLSLPCRHVFATGQRPVEAPGPLLQDESVVPHQDFWNSNS